MASREREHRGVAQSGSAPQWGCGGRRFESSRPDHSLPLILLAAFLLSACDRQPPSAERAFADGDYELAYTLWRERGERGEPAAQNYLGLHYYLGLGAPRDLPRAARWFAAAAEQGHPEAQRHLGIMYYNGYGVERDFLNAFMWYYAAYRQGSPGAKKYMDALSRENKLSPNQINQAKSRAAAFIVHSVVAERAAEGRLFRGQQAAPQR